MGYVALKHQIKKKLRQFLLDITPYTHFIPEKFRKWVSLKAFGIVEKPDTLPAPKPYVPGKHPMGINLFGFFKAENGLAQGVKQYAQALLHSSIPCRLLNTDFLSWLPQNDTTYDGLLSTKPMYAINVVHINPDQWGEACSLFPQKTFDHHYNIGVWLWELEEIPVKWHEAFRYVDELWAPSEFIANALRKVSPVPVTVIPYGIHVPTDTSLSRTDLGLPEDKFLVLLMYDSNSYASRKNPQAAIKAFLAAYGQQPERAHLVIKVNNPKEEDLAAIRSQMGDCTVYSLITETMPKKKLNALIHLCDVFISLHRSEGFGFVMAEAMALGTPVVATNWSANTEFMPEDAACLVDYELIEVNHAYQDGDDGQYWADAKVESAAKYLKRLESDAEYHACIQKKAKTYIENEFSVEKSAQKMALRVRQIQGSRAVGSGL